MAAKRHSSIKARSRKKQKQRRTGTGMICVAIIVIALLAGMSFQIRNLKTKEADYLVQEANLQEQLEEETQRAEEIEELSQYMQSTKYIEDMAKSKLGLVYEYETIYKESED